MTVALQKAFEIVSKLPDIEQDWIAAQLIAELESEDAFDAKIAATSDKLAAFARTSIAEGTLPLSDADFD